jgi:DNA-directed RNA polymerase subunit RPC12/RpoP
MEGNVRIQCPECSTWFLVLPRDVLKATGNVSGPEGEISFLEHMRTDMAQGGDRLAVADGARGYACPACSHPGQLPPVAELRRMAEEQGRSWPEE